jgi:hypothetical protein
LTGAGLAAAAQPVLHFALKLLLHRPLLLPPVGQVTPGQLLVLQLLL